jgi:MFS family permease
VENISINDEAHSHATTLTRLTIIALPFLVVGLASLFYVYEFFLRVIPSAIAHELMRDFAIHATMLSFLSACFYYAYALMQIPAGLLCDRFGPKRTMIVSVLICSLATFLFSTTQSIHVASISRFFMGIGASCAFIGPLLLASRWFPPRYYSTIAGIVQTLGCLGAIIGGQPIAVLSGFLGWHSALNWAASIGIAIAILYCLVLRDHPKQTLNKPQKVSGKNQQRKSPIIYISEWKRLKTICQNSQSWWTGLAGINCWAPIAVFELWGIPYLMQWHNVSASVAAQAMIWMWLGIAISSPLIGFWSNRIQSRCKPLSLCALLSMISSMLIIYQPTDSWVIMCSCLFLLGVSAGAQPITFGLVNDTHPPEISGTAVGFNNMAVIAGGPLLQPLVGMLLQSHWQGGYVDHAPLYTLSDFHYALSIMPFCGFFGWITSKIFVKETRCKLQYDHALSDH